MTEDDRTLDLLRRLDGRSIETLERVTRIEVETVQTRQQMDTAHKERTAILARVDRLEAERDKREGEVRAAQRTGIGGLIAGAGGVLAASAQAVFDWLTAGGP